MAFAWKRHSIVYQGRHLVGSLHAGHLGVARATRTDHVWKCQKQSVCWLTNRWPVTNVTVRQGKLYVVPSSCYLGNSLS